MSSRTAEYRVADLPAEWDALCRESPDATYAHTREWIQLLERHFAVRAIALAREDGDAIVGIYPGFLKAKWPGAPPRTGSLLGNLKVLWSPLDATWDYGGPCGDNPSCLALTETMERVAKRERAMEVRVSPWSPRVRRFLTMRGYRERPRETSVVDLTRGADILWQVLRKPFRNAVRRAENAGVHVKQVRDLGSLPQVYKCIRDVGERRLFAVPDYAFFRNMFLHQREIHVRAYLAEWEESPIAGAIVLEYHGVATTRWWGARRDPGLPPAGNIILWQIVREATARGLSLCDLGGLPSQPSEGIRRFKLGLGGAVVDTPWYVRDLLLPTVRSGLRHIRRGMGLRFSASKPGASG